ncbi:MAG: hypothetical protein R3F43_05645 [bacterium]
MDGHSREIYRGRAGDIVVEYYEIQGWQPRHLPVDPARAARHRRAPSSSTTTSAPAASPGSSGLTGSSSVAAGDIAPHPSASPRAGPRRRDGPLAA